ncbi:MAG: polymerase sigma factor FliA [Acidimicrobiaceae bacterium]|jgi:RNA polymerase sigma factor for flagellar operon FliA|nr:polymerase sigma factor FliA [Acidimicrobiaceae bacterium]MDQ1446060.1 polymerase sigma factor FliA [Acidimicrobiaceae bacterium]
MRQVGEMSDILRMANTGAAKSGHETTEEVDRRAWEDRLVRDHLPLVDFAVSQIAARLPRHVPRDELVSAAMAGLAQAARSFDSSRDCRFDHYAQARIRGALLDELRSRDWASRSVRSKARRLLAAHDALTASLGRQPTTDEVADKIGMEASAVDAISGDVHRSVILNYDSVIADAGADTLLPADEDSPDRVLLERERRAYLIDAVAALPVRLRHVVVGYFFEERPMQELADELGVSPSRISQMRAEAVAMLKDGMNSQLDPDAFHLADEESPRVAKRKAAYVAAVAAGSDFKARLSASTPRRAALSPS